MIKRVYLYIELFMVFIIMLILFILLSPGFLIAEIRARRTHPHAEDTCPHHQNDKNPPCESDLYSYYNTRSLP
jgi:hypothetical protein